MLAFYVTHPRWPRLKLRLVAYQPTHGIEHSQKVVVQATDQSGMPIAEDPLHTFHASREEVQQYIEDSISDGWVFTQDVEERRRINRYRSEGRRLEGGARPA